MSNIGTDGELDRIVGMLKALSNPQRMRIFLRLVECGGARARCRSGDEAVRQCVADLGEGTEIAPSTLSHHLKELRQAGLMDVDRRGRHLECAVRQDAAGLLAAFFTDAAARAGGESRGKRASPSR